MARLDRLKIGRMLLRLIGRPQHRKHLRIESDSQWFDILAMAGEHRLMPLLHARIERGEIDLPVPPHHREQLRIAHRESALRNLAFRSELYSATELMASEGLSGVTLKGGWLAWYAYPAAAERPMRDIDLLMPAEQALDAFNVLRANGYQQSEASAKSPAAMIETAKHLPPLISPSGVEFEIHMHAWEPPGSMEWGMPPLLDARILNHAGPGEAGDPCLYPKPQHMLMHLCIHAAYSHRFDIGPLLLADIDFLIHRETIDWKSFWRDAEEGGWSRGAALVLRLYWMWMRTDIQVLSACPHIAPIEAVHSAEALMLQDPLQRRNLGVTASVLGASEADGLGGGLQRVGQRLRGKHRARIAPDGESSENFANWFLRRSKETLSAFGNKELRGAARHHTAVGRWLEQGEA